MHDRLASPYLRLLTLGGHNPAVAKVRVATHLFGREEGPFGWKLYGVVGTYPSHIIAGQEGVAFSLKAAALLWYGHLNIQLRRREVMLMVARLFRGESAQHYADIKDDAVTLKDDGGVCKFVLSAAALFKFVCESASRRSSSVSVELLPHLRTDSFSAQH